MSSLDGEAPSPEGGVTEALPEGYIVSIGTTPTSSPDDRRSGVAAIGPTVDEGEMRLLLDHISDAVFATDAANRFTHWTASAERMFGYSAAEAMGHRFEELLSYRIAQPGDASEFLTTMEAGRTWRGLGTVRVREGREIWLESTVEPILADGRLLGSVSVARDVTATVQARLKLAEEERFVEAVLGATEALVIVLDPQGRVVRLNDACKRMSGYPAEEVLGRPLWEVLFPSAGVEAVRAEFADLKAAAFPNTHESQWMTVSGELRLIRWESTCLADEGGAVTHVIATGIDITEGRRMEKELEGELRLMHVLMENIPAQVYFKDLESRFIRINNNQARTLGLSDPRNAIGKTDFDFFTDEHARQAYEDEREIIRTGQPYGSEEKETRADLPDTWVSTTKLPLHDTDGRVIGTFGTSVDITERRQAQEALRDRVRLFTALADFASAVNAIREPERLATALVDAVNAVVPSDTAVITMLDRSDGRYRVRAVRGFDPGAVGAVIEPGDGTAGRVIAERAIVLTEPHPRAQTNAALRDFLKYEMVRTVGVPLIREDTVLGVISVARAAPGASFTDAESEVLALLGSHAALALTNANLMEEVSALAIHDGLTGLYNRRHFDAELDRAIARFKRRAPAGSLAAIMFDLDHFGDFNRQHGHLAGDALLRLFAGVLHERLRSADLVARYGGEEFVVILEDATLLEAVRVAEEVRRRLKAHTVPDAAGQPVGATVSAGCAVMDPADPTREGLLGRADAALFLAKNSGRNRVVGA